MKIISILLAITLLATSSLALNVTTAGNAIVANVMEKTPKPPKPPKPPKTKHPKKKPVPCACVCPGTLPGTTWSCSPTGCSTKHGTPCAAAGPSQSPSKVQPSIR